MNDFIDPNSKFVDLAALSLSGSLVPSVPTQLMIKYNPPKMTIVYHFQERSNAQFYHDILLDNDMLATKNSDDIVSHLYVTEAYYFNPKQVKRSQLLRLVGMIQNKLGFGHLNGNNGAQGQINIQDNAFGQDNAQQREARRKNFFEKKRFINYPQSHNDEPSDQQSEDGNGNNNFQAPGSANDVGTGQSSLIGNAQRRGATNANALNQRKRFDDLQIQNKVPSHSPQPDMPAIAAMPKLHTSAGQNHLQNLPPLKGQRQGPISDPIFLNNKKGNKMSNMNANSQSNGGLNDFVDNQHHLNPQYNDQIGGNQNEIGGDEIGYESGSGAEQDDQHNMQQQFDQNEDFGLQVQDNNNNYGGDDGQVYGEGVENVEEGDATGGDGEGEDDEGESVYMIDGVVMRMIQIEGEENQYLMDPQGRIYDMQANFIGTANTQGLEEMGADGQPEQEQNQ